MLTLGTLVRGNGLACSPSGSSECCACAVGSHSSPQALRRGHRKCFLALAGSGQARPRRTLRVQARGLESEPSIELAS